MSAGRNQSVAGSRSVRIYRSKRNLADWKSKIACERALQSAGDREWIGIGTFIGTTTTFMLHKMCWRSRVGLSVLSHAWLILVGSDEIRNRDHAESRTMQFETENYLRAQLELGEYDIVDIKPYLAYRDASVN